MAGFPFVKDNKDSMTYKRLVEQAKAMVNIVHKKYLSGNKMVYPALLLGVFRIESYPGAGHNYQEVKVLVSSIGGNGLTLAIRN